MAMTLNSPAFKQDEASCHVGGFDEGTHQMG